AGRQRRHPRRSLAGAARRTHLAVPAGASARALGSIGTGACGSAPRACPLSDGRAAAGLARLGWPPHRIRRQMIDADEVRKVARLARLQLSDEEIEPMARELSSVLDHIEKIGEL